MTNTPFKMKGFPGFGSVKKLYKSFKEGLDRGKPLPPKRKGESMKDYKKRTGIKK